MQNSIYRKDMPQIKSDVVKKFIKFLKKKHSVKTSKDIVQLSLLKPVQRDFDNIKIVSMTNRAKREGSKFLKKKIIISQDNFILDGHHRFMALINHNPNDQIKVYRIHTDIKTLIPLAHSFPKSFRKSINEMTTFKDFLNERNTLSLGKPKPKLNKKPEDPKITQKQIDQLEKYLDRVWKELDIDVEFTKHFKDRVNDSRNGKQITIEELKNLFMKIYSKHGKAINKSGNRHKDIGAVLTDLQTNVNSPIFLKWDNNKKEFEMVASTVMRKKNFKPNSPKEKKYTV